VKPASTARPIRVLIVDDERLARASLRVLLGRDPEIELVAECASAAAAADAIAAHAPELVFLDVEMPRADGFALLAAHAERGFAVVFVTAHEQYALDAFDAQAVDYLLKPFDDQRFARALARAKAHVRRVRLESLAAEMATVLPPRAAPAGDDRLPVKDGPRTLMISVADIDWIEADDYYVQLHVGARAYLLREPLRDLEARLDPARFVRVHRSAIVNLERVAALGPDAGGDPCVRLRDGTELRASRSRRARLRALLQRRD